MKFPVSMC